MNSIVAVYPTQVRDAYTRNFCNSIACLRTIMCNSSIHTIPAIRALDPVIAHLEDWKVSKPLPRPKVTSIYAPSIFPLAYECLDKAFQDVYLPRDFLRATASWEVKNLLTKWHNKFLLEDFTLAVQRLSSSEAFLPLGITYSIKAEHLLTPIELSKLMCFLVKVHEMADRRLKAA